MDSDLPQYALPFVDELIVLANVFDQGAEFEGDKYVLWIA